MNLKSQNQNLPGQKRKIPLKPAMNKSFELRMTRTQQNQGLKKLKADQENMRKRDVKAQNKVKDQKIDNLFKKASGIHLRACFSPAKRMTNL